MSGKLPNRIVLFVTLKRHLQAKVQIKVVQLFVLRLGAIDNHYTVCSTEKWVTISILSHEYLLGIGRNCWRDDIKKRKNKNSLILWKGKLFEMFSGYALNNQILVAIFAEILSWWAKTKPKYVWLSVICE